MLKFLHLVLGLAVGAGFVGPAIAASFDCAAARTPSEKLVCGDAPLSALDERLAQEYAAAAAVVPRVDALRQEQRQWVAESRDKAANAAAMRAAYEGRIAALHDAAAAARGLRVEIDTATLSQRCVKLRQEADESCAVDESGRTADSGLFYQLQSYQAGDLRTAGGVVVLRQAAAGKLLPLVWDVAETAHYAPPELVASPSGRLLHIPGSIEGTGNYSAASLYQERNGAWQAIDIDAWQATLGGRLPKGLAVWKGVYPDWGKMTVDTPLWRDSDGNCCPTGGSAHAILALRGDRIVLVDLRLSKEPLP